MALKVDYAGFGVDICLVCGLVVAEGEEGCRHLYEQMLASEFLTGENEKYKAVMSAAYKLMHLDYYCVSDADFALLLLPLALSESHNLSNATLAKVESFVANLKDMPKFKAPIFRGYNPLRELEAETDQQEFIDTILDWGEEVYDTYVEAHDSVEQLLKEML